MSVERFELVISFLRKNLVIHAFFLFCQNKYNLKGLDHGYAHARRHALQNKFVGSTINSKTPLLLQSFKIRRFVFTSVALAGPVILQY